MAFSLQMRITRRAGAGTGYPQTNEQAENEAEYRVLLYKNLDNFLIALDFTVQGDEFIWGF